MGRRAYPSDLSDAEYAVLGPHPPAPEPRGRPRRWPLRTILDGISSIVRTGAQRRQLPHEYPPWPTVYRWFRRWRLDAPRERLDAALRERLRDPVGRRRQPSAGVIDSRSVETATVGGVHGYDGAKKVSGRKRHLPVETQGLVLRAKVHTAALRDRAAVPLLLEGAAQRFPRLEHVRVDQGYTGTGEAWIEQEPGRSVEVVQHPRTRERGFLGVMDPPAPGGSRLEYSTARGKEGFRGVLPRRWAAERTFSWLGQSRRLSEEYEHLCETSEALIYATMTRLMARRLARI